MADLAGIDFNAADHRQRKLLRVTLMSLFRRERALAMFLDEEMGLVLSDEVEDGKFKEQVWELVTLLSQRGRLDELMETINESPEFANAPALRDLVVTWRSVSPKAAARKPRRRKEPLEGGLERILDGEVNRISPQVWLSGLATLRRRVCLLRIAESPVATGFLVAPNLVLTTAEAVHDAAGDGDRKFEAVFDLGLGGQEADAARVVAIRSPRVVEPAAAPQASAGYEDTLDYALLQLAKPIGSQSVAKKTPRGWFDLTDKRERLRVGESIFLLHFPEGQGMVVSFGTINPLTERPGLATRIVHDCQTTADSSGAPVLDATLRLVGVHETRVAPSSVAIRADRIARDLAARGVVLKAPPERPA